MWRALTCSSRLWGSLMQTANKQSESRETASDMVSYIYVLTCIKVLRDRWLHSI